MKTSIPMKTIECLSTLTNYMKAWTCALKKSMAFNDHKKILLHIQILSSARSSKSKAFRRSIWRTSATKLCYHCDFST